MTLRPPVGCWKRQGGSAFVQQLCVSLSLVECIPDTNTRFSLPTPGLCLRYPLLAVSIADCVANKCVGGTLGISLLGGVCGTKIPNGLSCLTDDSCKSRRCSDFKCKDRLADGESCSATSDCISSKCTGIDLLVTTLGGRCGATLANGDSCLNDGQCSSGRCEMVGFSFKCQARLGKNQGCNENSGESRKALETVLVPATCFLFLS